MMCGWMEDFFVYLLTRFLKAIGFRKKVIEGNLDLLAAQSLFQEERKVTVHKIYVHHARLFLGFRHLLFRSLKRVAQKHTVFHGMENWKTAKAKNRGVLLLASHVGHWEIMIAGGAIRGIDGMMVTKKLKPGWLHRWIEKARADVGMVATYEPKTLRDVFSHFKKNGTVGMVVDQYAGPPVGRRVPFFGIPVGTQMALAVLKIRTNVPILPTYSFWNPVDRKHHIFIEPELDLKVSDTSDEDLEQAWTLLFNQTIERHIRSHPHQWLWSHRRFKGDLGPVVEWGRRSRKG